MSGYTPTARLGLCEGQVAQGELVLESIIADVGVEISRLQQVRALLANAGSKCGRSAK
jgi:hypothetical protein